jgi:hypothetical protein
MIHQYIIYYEATVTGPSKFVGQQCAFMCTTMVMCIQYAAVQPKPPLVNTIAFATIRIHWAGDLELVVLWARPIKRLCASGAISSRTDAQQNLMLYRLLLVSVHIWNPSLFKLQPRARTSRASYIGCFASLLCVGPTHNKICLCVKIGVCTSK